jgi:type IV secretory pathway component VirB8
MVVVAQYMMQYQLQLSHQSIIICRIQRLLLNLLLATVLIISVVQVLPHRCVVPHLSHFLKQTVGRQVIGSQRQLVQAIQF